MAIKLLPDGESIDVTYSHTTDPRRIGMRRRLLNGRAAIAAGAHADGGNVILDSRERNAWLAVDHADEELSWSHWAGGAEKVQRTLRHAINEVVTEQLDAQPSVLLVPFKNHFYIQYPKTTSSGKTERYILLRRDLEAMQSEIKQELKADGPAELHPWQEESLRKASIPLGIAIQENSEHTLQVPDLSANQETELLERLWSHRDPLMNFVEVDDILFAKLNARVGNLPQFPLFIGYKVFP
ncbi:hypothetical protein PtB15_5B219 [Puccinia triticina]|nr:hypothetical protein PtB15_5B219 [Puccinia triticina]